MDLDKLPDYPTICTVCQHYYNTYILTKEDFRPPSRSSAEHEAKIKEAKDNAEWHHHRCKAKVIKDFNPITGKILSKDEYCTNINTDGRCKYFREKSL
jgi:hypothetical protein